MKYFSFEDMLYIETQEALQQAVEELKKEKALAIDLECENNLHHYGMYISLVQVSTQSKQYIFDIIALKTLGGLQDILESEHILKVFHDVSFDLRILNHEFDCKPKYIRDTKLASTFLKKENVGLRELLKEYFGIEKKKKFQMADWTARPIRQGMLEYAAADTTHLLGLYEKLKEQLQDKNYYEWFKQECQDIENNDWHQKIPEYSDLKGFKKLNNTEKNIAKALYNLREDLAQKVDKPPHFVFGNKQLLAFAQRPPKSVTQWSAMKGVHPIVKRKAATLFEAVKKAKASSFVHQVQKPQRYTLAQRNHFAQLNRAREKIASETGLLPHVILNKDQMQHIVLEQNFNSLRPWQEKLLAPHVK